MKTLAKTSTTHSQKGLRIQLNSIYTLSSCLFFAIQNKKKTEASALNPRTQGRHDHR